MDEVLDAISAQGWAHLRWWDGRDVASINARYRKLFERHPVGHMHQSLRPLDKVAAKPGTMSAFIGLDRQPPHTDKAHFAIPPRYIILHCQSEGQESCPTVMWELDWKRLESAPPPLVTTPGWLIRRSVEEQFYGRVIEFGVDGIGRLRFDPFCMSFPTRTNAVLEALDALLGNARMFEFDWKQGDTLLLDNWRLLHGRAALKMGFSTRRLLRWISGGSDGLGIRKVESESVPLWTART